MARKTITRLVDDLDGTEIKAGAGQTVTFGLDGKAYEIDLSDKNADMLRSVLSRYVSAGRKVSGRSAGRGAGRGKAGYSAIAVREWAKANKVELSPRGRIAQSVIEQFRAAGN